MAILESIKQINWQTEDNKIIAQNLSVDSIEYIKRVEAHIYKGNEIRSDSFMDIVDKQDAIRRLDNKRTEAHNRMLSSFEAFKRILIEQTDFDESDYMLENRTQIADFIATIAFELLGLNPTSQIEGNARDELAELLHQGTITYEQIEALLINGIYDANTEMNQ